MRTYLEYDASRKLTDCLQAEIQIPGYSKIELC